MGIRHGVQSTSLLYPTTYQVWGIMFYPPLKIALSVSNVHPSIRHPFVFALYLEHFLTAF